MSAKFHQHKVLMKGNVNRKATGLGFPGIRPWSKRYFVLNQKFLGMFRSREAYENEDIPADVWRCIAIKEVEYLPDKKLGGRFNVVIMDDLEQELLELNASEVTTAKRWLRKLKQAAQEALKAKKAHDRALLGGRPEHNVQPAIPFAGDAVVVEEEEEKDERASIPQLPYDWGLGEAEDSMNDTKLPSCDESSDPATHTDHRPNEPIGGVLPLKWDAKSVANFVRNLGKEPCWETYANMCLEKNVDGAALAAMNIDRLQAFGFKIFHANLVRMRFKEEEQDYTVVTLDPVDELLQGAGLLQYSDLFRGEEYILSDFQHLTAPVIELLIPNQDDAKKLVDYLTEQVQAFNVLTPCYQEREIYKKEATALADEFKAAEVELGRLNGRLAALLA